MAFYKKMTEKHIEIISVFYKISFITISLFFVLLNFPLLDWFLHSEKTWYDEYELNPDTSFMYVICEKLGILDETLGFIYSMTYGSKWMHLCYHLYNVTFDWHPPLVACSSVFVALLTVLAVKDMKNCKKEKFRKTLIFYIIPSAVVLIICIYGFFVYSPQYHSTVYEIISCI